MRIEGRVYESTSSGRVDSGTTKVDNCAAGPDRHRLAAGQHAISPARTASDPRGRFTMRFPFGGRGRVAALGAALLLLAAGGVAYATIPDAGGVIHGCYKNSNG